MLLRILGAMTAESAHKWAEVFISDDLDEFDCENRGDKHSAEFYDFFLSWRKLPRSILFKNAPRKLQVSQPLIWLSSSIRSSTKN